MGDFSPKTYLDVERLNSPLAILRKLWYTLVTIEEGVNKI